MRNATQTERDSVDNYIKSISKPTGVYAFGVNNRDAILLRCIRREISAIPTHGTGGIEMKHDALGIIDEFISINEVSYADSN